MQVQVVSNIAMISTINKWSMSRIKGEFSYALSGPQYWYLHGRKDNVESMLVRWI